MNDEEKIRRLEKRIEELEKKTAKEEERDEEEIDEEKGDGEEESINIDSIVGQFIPGLGGIVKALEKSSPEFRKRIADTDAQIKHRLESGWSMKPEVTHGISFRPISGRSGIKPKPAQKEPEKERVETEVPEPIIDIFEEKDYISVIAEFPGIEEKVIVTKVKDDTLEISAGKYSKTIKLPCAAKSIVERTWKNGILQLKIER
jgi:HSP20 family protein